MYSVELGDLNDNNQVSKTSNIIKLNYFPNDPSKQIDYVIQYKEIPTTDKNSIQNKKCKQMRNKFITQLKMRQGFDIYKIVKTKDKPENSKSIYLLLHCSLDRLMQEAERMHLELPLKDVSFIK